jgi:hypothetical protein
MIVTLIFYLVILILDIVTLILRTVTLTNLFTFLLVLAHFNYKLIA